MQRGTTCKYTRQDGSQCRSAIVMPSGYCHMHDPARKPHLREVQSAGGRGKSTSARAAKLIPSTLRPVLNILLAALPRIEAGELDPRTASALAAVSSAIVRVYQAGTLEERVAALESLQSTTGGRSA